MNYIVFAWISSVSYTLLAIFSKLASNKATNNPWLLNFIWTFGSFLLLIPLFIINGGSWPSEWLYLILAGVSNAVWFILYAFSLYRLDVTVISPMYSFQTLFVVILSFLFLNETLNAFQIFLFIITILAGIIVNLDEKFKLKSFFSSSVGILIVGMFFLALSRIFTNLTLKSNGIWETTLGIVFITTIVLLPTITKFKKDLGKLNIANSSSLLLMSLTYVVGTVTAYQAFKDNVSISSIIISLPLTIFFVLVISRFKPKLLEEHSAKVYAVRFIGTVVMVAAALLISG
ncbi:MAG TPA: EamA family transporter [Candidatus Dojkabacteria bacterium]